MTNIPKRRFALEEKDLSVEADENNRVAEEKENRFVKKIQEEALNGNNIVRHDNRGAGLYNSNSVSLESWT